MFLRLCLSSVLMFIVESDNQEPCETNNFIDDWTRSVAYNLNDSKIQERCDSFLVEDWYRVVSGAGELMPTECPVEGFQCGTMNPVWLSTEGVLEGEDTYPAVGKTVSRLGFVANYENCVSKKYPIKIKNCGQYYVYYLKPVQGCPSAYCFGTERPCPAGQSSETGFTPGCGSFPNVTVSPKVSVQMHQETERGKVHVTPKFECSADDATEEYRYDVKYYINNVQIDKATHRNVLYDDLEKASMLQTHWEDVFKPNMFVKCSMQVRADGYTSPGPQTFSTEFFAGIKIKNIEKGFIVDEGKKIKIPIEFTLPVGCIYPLNSPAEQFFREKSCFVDLYNAIPKYQKDDCASKDLQFLTQKCKVRISNSNWNKQHYVEIRGEVDQKVNIRNRLTFLRLWSDAFHASTITNLGIWNNVHLPDIKVLINDTEEAILTSSCYSHNDPHMRTFDGTTWELQDNFDEPSAGEYIMYKHERLPQQINAYFRECNPGYPALCNCGVAVRSANSLFVANFCETKYKGEKRVNRYVASWMCDDQNLVVTESGNTYKVQLPSGTLVEFSHRNVVYGNEKFYGIQNIDIQPSQFDFNHTTGLCGRFNGYNGDDFIEQHTFINHPNDIWRFAKSWKIEQKDSLFEGKLPDIKYFLQEYCTCNTPATKLEPPSYTCLKSSQMNKCRQTQTAKSVYHASCITSNYRSKRDVSEIDYTDEKPPMYPIIIEPEEEHVRKAKKRLGWKNGLTDEIAKDKCQRAFAQTISYSACSKYVPSVNSTDYVEECVEDMKIIGDDRFLKVTLENFASKCLGNAKKMENLTTTTNRTEVANGTEVLKPEQEKPVMMSILEIIEQSTCPDNCSGNGICQEGVCRCDHDFFGIDCSNEKTKAPLIETSAFESICDSSKRPCKTIIIPGLDFYPENLTCKFRPFQFMENETHIEYQEKEEAFTNRGIYRSLFLMFCEIPDSRSRRSADLSTIANGYFISISNDGLNFTEELAVVSFDARCYSCNITGVCCTKEYKLDCPLRKIKVADDEDNTINIGIGIGVGVVVILFIAGVMFVYFRKRNKKTHRGYDFSKEQIAMSDTQKDQQLQE
ncbi:von Willebrand factor D and EGF domain-containing protein-like isoform X1 [Mytilus edulis]|uniref:von Willebrand factor D and EGF domain-containing protein-like isoform X1 n=1 Tax=Mytilus edulis TaxID=6550 RepID=UPI0039F006EE